MRTINAYECQFLAALLKYPELIYQYDDLKESHFTSSFPATIYRALKNTDIDELKKYGSPGILSELFLTKNITADERSYASNDFDILSINITSYCAQQAYRAIQESYLKTILISKINRLDTEKPLDEIIFDIQECITGLAGHEQDEVIQNMEEVAHEIAGQQENPAKITIGIPCIDRDIVLEKNSFVIFASRPFCGKTTLACKVAVENTIEHKVLFYSLEMTKKQIWNKVKNYGPYYNLKNFLLIQKTTIDLNKLIRTAVIVKPGLIIIDQLNKINEVGQTEYERFTNIARKLKIIAGNLQIPIICLAQINRSAENKRPWLYQLKSSGSLEEEADVVVMLHVPDTFRVNKKTEIYIDKNRTHYNSVGMTTINFKDNNYFE